MTTGYPAWFFFSSRRRHTRCLSDWSSDVCSSDLVHGAGGTLGAMLTGVFATSAINDGLKVAGKVQPLGLVDGNSGQVVNQALGVAIAWGLAIAGTLIILKTVDATLGLRVTRDQESDGLDLSMHNEEGYILEG